MKTVSSGCLTGWRICFCLIGILTPVARPAIYYISKDGGEHCAGSDTPPYDTWAKAAISPKTVVDYVRSHGAGAVANIIYIDADTFASDDAIRLDHANHSATILIGAGRGRTILSPSSHNAIYGSGASNITVQDLTIRQVVANAVYKESSAADWTFQDVDFESTRLGNGTLINLRGNTTRFLRCQFHHAAASEDSYTVFMTGDAGATFVCCISSPAVMGYQSGQWYLGSSGETEITNSIV